MPLDTPGSHAYVLDSITDSLGNSRKLTPTLGWKRSNFSETSTRPLVETTRSATVVRRAAMSFKDCGPGNPSSLLIGGESHLAISAKESDSQDGPWDVTVNYVPSNEVSQSKKAIKPWKRTITTPDGRSGLTLNVNGPGEYSIVGVKGRYCPGDVLSPETCRVVEQPYPSADIEWKRIHEW